MEGRRKEVLLLVVAACALAVALITFLGRSGPPPPPPAAPGPADLGARAERQADEQARQQSDTAETETARNPFSAPSTAGPSDLSPPDSGSRDVLPAAPAEPVGAPLRLTGIVVGTPSVAIIRQADQRYFVKVGEQIGDGYRVKRIGRQQVVLTGQEGTIILRMGGRQ